MVLSKVLLCLGKERGRDKYAYTPFGTMSDNSVETIQQPFRFGENSGQVLLFAYLENLKGIE